ncbi:Pantetheinase [Camelus dromedarius]|uniref:Pantetheinase n=1 Tax=Camelus dromedarius TaxID=9838 RepID=A0A5N4DW74_CAMDR|nr:Pantetheinase [Camelus dromedarius]
MIISYFPKYVAVLVLLVLSVSALDTFIAAVYEHAVILPNRTETPVSKEETLLLMNKNIDVLEKAIKLAARKKELDLNSLQERLSCLAKNNTIYVVANIGDKKPCNASDPQCPPDGRYQYNTDVVFDSEGRLVARYHKYNLFAPEIQFDFPKDPEFVTFNTPFGKFGIFTCFDIFSHEPAVVVVEEFQVDSIVYPTAWYNTLPLLSAVPFHSAWARAMGVNLLAANTHNTSMHMTGSGIYSPDAVKVYHYDMETESGQLMLSELKSWPRRETISPAAVDWSAYARAVKPFSSEQLNFPGMIYFDEFTFTELKRNAGNYTVCQKDLCCHLTYRMSEKRTDEVYALGAFDGLHTVEGQYYLQVETLKLVRICTLLKCQTTELRTCGEPVGSVFTKFEEFSLSGTFGTSYVFPQILLSGSQLASETHYKVGGLALFFSQPLDFNMITSQLLDYVAILLFWVLKASSLDTFIAAVYEHAVIFPNVTLTPVSHEEALDLMNQNLDLLEGAITLAAKQGAHIIVTPEDGIYSFAFSRESIYPYLEDIPDPQVNWIPCNNPNRFGRTPVQERLSCLAKSNSIYVVANIGDKKPCSASDPQCPPDGRYQYNTNVVFDSEGRLVARYHKQNLFLTESHFNAPKEPEVVTFNTTFGKFGIFTCFDILFHDPAVTLVKDFHVDTILFPTAWMNVLPHLSAIEFHSAWAVGMGVNFLAANLHYPIKKMTGSGIYAPDSPKAFHYDMKTEEGKLLLSHLDAHPHPRAAVNWTSYASGIEAPSVGNREFNSTVFFDEYTFLELKGVTGNYTICTLLKCKTMDLHTCGDSVETASTRFEMFSLSGTFGTQYVFPEVLLSEVQLAPGQFQVSSDGRLFSPKPLSGPVLTVTLFGRLYEKDPVPNASSDFTVQALRVMLIVITSIVYLLS